MMPIRGRGRVGKRADCQLCRNLTWKREEKLCGRDEGNRSGPVGAKTQYRYSVELPRSKNLSYKAMHRVWKTFDHAIFIQKKLYEWHSSKGKIDSLKLINPVSLMSLLG